MEKILRIAKPKGEILKLFVITLVAVSTFYLINFVGPSISKNYVGNTVIARAADSPKDAFQKAQNAKGGVLGQGVKDKTSNIGADITSIVMSVVLTIISVTTLWTSTKFTGVGDDGRKKSELKAALIGQIGGIAFLASASGLILFGLENLNLFS